MCVPVQVGSSVESAQGGVAQDIEGGLVILPPGKPVPAAKGAAPKTLQQDVVVYLFQTRPQ